MTGPQKPSAINVVWLMLVLGAIVVAAWTGAMEATTERAFSAAREAVELAIGLVGALALWLGVVRVAEEAGLMRTIARAIRPVMRRLFPDVPADHPAMSAMVLNLSANVLGLGNAATPLGIKAMMELDRLNPDSAQRGGGGTATDAMCLFLAINTSSVTLVPVTVMAVRASAGAASAAAIVLPTILATACSTTVAIVAAKLLARRRPLAVAAAPGAATAATAPHDPPATAPAAELQRPSWGGRSVVWLLIAALAAAIPYRLYDGEAVSALSAEIATAWLVPLLMGGLLAHGWLRGVKVYEVAAEGAKEGFLVAVRIIPFLVVIFVAIGMFRASGAFDSAVAALDPALAPVGMPPDVLPLALLRPLSGSAALGWMTEIVRQAPDSFPAYLASTMQGSTETTFYVLAVYFGAVGIRRTRHALPAALLADATGIIAALAICHALY